MPFVAERLYGINKWAGENNFDLVLHIHFNDFGSRKWNREGEFSGFAVYVPEKQFPNKEVSIKIGSFIHDELEKVQFKSNQPQEAKYVELIEDQQLIALGAKENLNIPSVLIEYGYIYEPLFMSSVKGEFLRVLRKQLLRVY